MGGVISVLRIFSKRDLRLNSHIYICCVMSHSCEIVELDTPPLQQVVKALEDALNKNFAECSVQTTPCPDLSASPFHLAAPGFGEDGDKATLIDVGGVPNLMPRINNDALFDLEDIRKVSSIDYPAFMIGPGAGPMDTIGRISECCTNVVLGHKQEEESTQVVHKDPFCSVVHKDPFCSVVHKDPSCSVVHKDPFCSVVHKVESRLITCDHGSEPSQQILTVPRCGFMMNLLSTTGRPNGTVIQVRAKRRTGELDLIESLRLGLSDAFDGTVGMGGVFVVEEGTAKLHVMPGSAECELATLDQINAWLTWHEVDAPLICLSVFYSSDPGLDLRIGHTHCFKPPDKQGAGGHYHCDTTPADVSYLGYFVLGDRLARVARPQPNV